MIHHSPRRRAGAALAVLLAAALTPLVGSGSAGAATEGTPPTTVTGLHVIGKTSTSVRLGWNPATDNVGVVGYDVLAWRTRFDGTRTSLTVTLHSLKPNRQYTFNVFARDAAGNRSATPATISVKTLDGVAVDPTAPSAPTELTVGATTTSSVSLSWTASTDNVGVTQYAILRNGDIVSTSTSTSFVDTGLPAATTFQYVVKAKDAEGNVSKASAAVSATTKDGTVTPPSGCSATWQTFTDWGSGFVAGITVTNTSSSDLKTWRVRGTLPSGITMTGMWNAQGPTSGGTIDATPPSYYWPIASGGTISFGVQGTTGGATLGTPALTCTSS